MKTLAGSGKRQTRVSTRRDIRHTASTRANGQPPKINSILVPIDFSTPSLKAFKYALDYAKEFHAKVTLLHVLEVLAVPEFATYPIVPDSDRMEAVKRKLTQLATRRGAAPGVLAAVKVRTGVPFKEITRAAESLKIDLIVIATHGYTGLAHVLLGSTAERVVRHARCPVLVVPARK